jgi:ribosomal protein S17E
MENDVDATIETTSTEATVRRKVDERLGFKEPFIKVPGYVPAPALVAGTPENNSLLHDAFNSDKGRRYFKEASAALDYSTKLKQADAAFSAKEQEIMKEMDMTSGTPAHAGARAKLEKLQSQERPRHSPYGDFLAGLGSTPNEVVSEIIRRNDKATWYFEKYKALGLGKLIEQNEGVLDDPEGLARLMKVNGFFDPQTDEENFFRTTAKDPYSPIFGHSVWRKAQGEFKMQMLKSGFSPASLPFQMQAGRQLDPNDPKDQKLYMDAWDFQKSEEGQAWYINAGNAGIGIVEDALGSVFKTAASLKPNGDNIEFEFDGDFVDPKGANFELKQRFLSQWRELNQAYREGRLGEETSMFHGYRKFVDKDKVVDSSSGMFDIYDPASKKEVPAKFEEMIKTFREIRSKGGFKHDVYGLTSAMSFVDGALQLTAGFGMMWASSDPDSFLSGIAGKSVFWGKDWRDTPDLGKNLEFESKHGFGKTQIWEGMLKERMRFFNMAYRWHNTAEHWRDTGLVAPEALFDRELANHAAGWADVSLLLGPGRAIAKAMFAKTGGRAIEALGLAQAVEKRYMTTSFNIEEAVRKGVALPQELTDAINAVVAESKAAGIAISEQDAIKKIFNGHPVIIDPATGARVAMNAEQMISISRKVSDSMEAMQAVRNHIAQIATESRRTAKYTPETRKIMSEARDWLIKNEKSGVNWANVSSHELYEMIKNGKVTIPGKVLPPSKLEKVMKEVGKTWQNIDPHDIAGWQRTGRLPIELGFNATSMMYRGLATTLSWFGSQSERWQAIARKYGPDQTATAVTVRNAAKLGQESVGVGVAQAPWYKAWTIAHSAPAVANFIGGVGDWLKHMNEYKEYASKLGGTKFGSALKAMESDTLAAIKRIDLQIEQAMANPSFMSKSDVNKLMNKRGELFAKFEWAKNTHAWTENAWVSGTMGVMVNGVVHGLYNEGLMYLADTRNTGSMFGFTAGSTGINKLIHAGLVRQISPSASIEEKTNNSMVEFQGHLAQKLEGNDNQKGRWIELYMKEARKAQEVSVKLGEDAGKRYWAHALEAMNGLFRTNAAVELHDPGFIEGRVAIMRDLALRENPVEFQRILAEYTAEANRLGIEGDEAIAYANLKLDAYRNHNASQSRKVDIADEIAALEKEAEHLNSVTSKQLFRLEQAAKIMIKDLGLSPESVTMDINNVLAGGTILIDGKPIEQHANLDIRTKAIERIQALWKEHGDIVQLRMQNEARVKEINARLQQLENESVTLNSSNPAYSYRPGEVIVDEANGTRLTSYKDGITIWEQTDSQGNVGVKIILDRHKFSLETAWEETIHALTYTENAQRGITMMNSAFFGSWQQDPNNPGRYIQAKTDPKTGQLVDAPPMISGDLDTNIGLLEVLANSYSDGLSQQEKAVFMAKFRAGVENFKRNPTDLRQIEPIMAELIADVYRFRKAMSSPFTARGEWSPSTASGSFEAGPNVAGIKSPRLWQKIASGQVTWADLALEGRELNVKEIGLGLPLDQLTPEQDAIQRRMAATGNFLRTFGFGGTFDVAVKQSAISKAFELGLHANKVDLYQQMVSGGNGQTIFNTRQMYDADGNLVPVPESLQRAVSVVVNETRGWGSRQIQEQLFPTDESIRDREASTDKADVEARVRWAFSTGRRSWINAAGQFKRPWWELANTEAQPMRDLFRVVIEDQKKNGNVYGLRVQRIANGGYAIAGTPNLEQSKAVRDFLKERMLKTLQTDDIPTTYSTIMTFMTSMAEGNIFDSKASRPGRLLTYNGTYMPVWAASGTGTYGTNRYRSGTERDMNFMPFAMVVQDSTLDFAGETMEAGKGAKKEQVSLPTVYFWALDLDNLGLRRQLAMRGELKDSFNEKYFEKGELYNLFGKDFNLFNRAMETALANWANSGSFEKGTKEFQIPERTWKALLPLTENSKGKTDPNLAKAWAHAIQRIIGFPTNQFKELTLLEKELMTGKVGERDMTASEKAEKKAQLKILRAKDVVAKNEAEKALAKAGATAGRNEFGEASSLDTKESAFMLIRPDRFKGVPQPLRNGDGSPISMTFSNWGSLAGGVNWSTNNWTNLTPENIRQETSGYNLSNRTTYGAWKHDSGYKVFLMAEKDIKTGTWGSSSYVVFDPQRNVVNQFTVKDLNQAFSVASQHAESNPQQPMVANTYEMSMVDNGWLPKGSNVVGRMRDRFVSGSGEWMIQRSGSGAFDLIHVPTGFTIAKKLSVYSVDSKSPVVDLKDVNAAIADAVENNTIHARVREERHAQLDREGLAEWHMVPDVDARNKGVVKNKKELVFQDTPEYYNFKRLLTYGTEQYAGLGHAFAKEVLDLMKQELGPDVIAKDRYAVMRWIDNWSKSFTEEKFEQIARTTAGDIDASNAKAAAESAQEALRNHGQKLVFNKPTKPTRATMVDKDGKVPPEWLDEKGQLRAEISKAFMDRYAEEHAAWEEHEKKKKGIQPIELEKADYNTLMTAIKLLRENFSKWEQDQAQRKVVGEVTDLESQDIINKIAGLRTSGLEAKEAAKSKWLVNNFGYMIQGMFYKEPKPALGIEVSIGRIGLFSNRLYEGSNYILQTPSQLPKTKFVLYSPSGAMIGTYGSIDDANSAAMDHELNRTAEDNKREIELKEMLNPNQKTNPTQNIYRRFIEQLPRQK